MLCMWCILWVNSELNITFVLIMHFNSLVPGNCGCNLKLVILIRISRTHILSIFFYIALRWMPHGLSGDWLTLWGRVTHICVSRQTIIGSDNGLSPGRRQAIIWTSDGILLKWPLRTILSVVLIKSYILSFKKMHLKMSSVKWRPLCLWPQCVNIGSGYCQATSHHLSQCWSITGPKLVDILLYSTLYWHSIVWNRKSAHKYQNGRKHNNHNKINRWFAIH